MVSKNGIDHKGLDEVELATRSRRATATPDPQYQLITPVEVDGGEEEEDDPPVHRPGEGGSGDKDKATESSSRLQVALFLSFKIVLVLAVAGVGIGIHYHQGILQAAILSLTRFVERVGAISLAVLAGVSAALIALFFPLEIILLALGYILTRSGTYGFNRGFPIALATALVAMTGSLLANFFACRFFLHNVAMALFQRFKTMRAFMKAVEKGGVRFIALVRLSPFIPFAISNCVLGVTDIKFVSVLAAMPFAIPCISVALYIGSCLGDLGSITTAGKEGGGADKGWDPVKLWIMGGGILVTLGTFAYIVYLTRKQLAEAALEEEEEGVLLLQSSRVTPQNTTVSGKDASIQITIWRAPASNHSPSDIDIEISGPPQKQAALQHSTTKVSNGNEHVV